MELPAEPPPAVPPVAVPPVVDPPTKPPLPVAAPVIPVPSLPVLSSGFELALLSSRSFDGVTTGFVFGLGFTAPWTANGCAVIIAAKIKPIYLFFITKLLSNLL